MKVIIEGTLAQEFELEADSIDACIELALEKYKDGELCLCPGELQYVSIYVDDDETAHVFYAINNDKEENYERN